MLAASIDFRRGGCPLEAERRNQNVPGPPSSRKSWDMLKPVRKKPIDRWLALTGIAIGVAVFLLPKNEYTVVLGCILFFAVLAHPVWHFWWVERGIFRRGCAIAVLLVASIYMGKLAIEPSDSGLSFKANGYYLVISRMAFQYS